MTVEGFLVATPSTVRYQITGSYAEAVEYLGWLARHVEVSAGAGLTWTATTRGIDLGLDDRSVYVIQIESR